MATPDPDPLRCERCRRRLELDQVLELLGKLLCSLCFSDCFAELRSAECTRPRVSSIADGDVELGEVSS